MISGHDLVLLVAVAGLIMLIIMAYIDLIGHDNDEEEEECETE